MRSNDHQTHEAVLDDVDVPAGVNEEQVEVIGKILLVSIFMYQYQVSVWSW